MIQRVRRGIRSCLAIGTLVTLAACHATAEKPSGPDARLLDGSTGDDWPAYGRTYGEQHFSPLTQINRDTVAGLKLAWWYDLPAQHSASVPIEVGGVLYTATGHSVIRAFQAATGRLLWEYDPKASEAAGERLRQGWGSRGLAWWDGKVYTGTQDGRLIAIDAASGKEVWSVQTLMDGDHRFISAPPRVFAGKIVVGHGGGDTGAARGYVTAYDAATGKQLWRFFTVPGNPAKAFENKAMEAAAKTWSGEWWKNGGGGTVWNAITYDKEFDQILIGVGNGYPWNHRVRSRGKGDNLFLCSIVALDANTGQYKWHYQINPGESWDYNASMDMQLTTLKVDGKERKVLVQAPKNGFFYVIDRGTGKLISAKPIVETTWASRIDMKTGRPVENPRARYPEGSSFRLLPGPSGAHSWSAMALDPRTSTAYIPIQTRAGIYSDKGIDTAHWKSPGHNLADSAVMLSMDDGPSAQAALLAWDARAQREVWRIPVPGVFSSGVLALGGDILFQGWADGSLNAFDARTGRKLWSFQTGSGIIAAPISFAVDGRQYVAVISGWGTSAGIMGAAAARWGWDYRTQPRRVLVFSLSGKAPALPRSEPFRATAFADAGYRPDPAQALQGAIVYGRRCLACHGSDAIAAGTAPDLRTSPIVADPDLFRQIVYKGALVPNGMPRFGELTEQELLAVRQYLRAQAAALRSAG